MASNMPNRETYRNAVATLLNAALVGTGKPAQIVYNYKIAKLDGQTPVVVVTTGGSSRGPRENLAYVPGRIDIDIFNFVLYGVVSEVGAVTWTAENSDDTLDLLEKSVLDVIMNYSGPYQNLWSRWWVNGDSEPDEVLMGSDIYRLERIPTSMEIT